jgi:adenylate cyclase
LVFWQEICRRTTVKLEVIFGEYHKRLSKGIVSIITSWVKFGFLNGYPKILTVEIANLLTHYIKSCNYLVILLKSIFSITDHLQTLQPEGEPMSAEQKATRKLRAILSADAKGYSLLMADDETFTIQILQAYRYLMSDLIIQYSGRVVDSPGDNLLAEFPSAVDAVECAMAIQKRLKKENDRLVEGKRLEFRMGVNIGDVVQDGDRIYGSGVNIAARIEGISDPGGICVSRSAYDQVKDKLDFTFEYVGEHEVKNIKEPVRVYKVLLESGLPAPLADEPLELPDKPSIAVLPFVNMSGDPGQEYFSDGLTEQIINGLCKVLDLFVIARNSSFAYKGKSVNVKQVAKELGVRYILEGSVQKAGDRVRITAQLIDSTVGYHLWSENFDREISDIFTLQDEITLKLINTMKVELIYGEQARLWGAATKNLQAFDLHMRGDEHFFRNNASDNKQARKFYEEAISIDNTFALAYTNLGFTHMIDILYGWTNSPMKSFEAAGINAQKALAINNSIDLPHLLLGWVNLFKRQHDEAIKEAERAVELNPNGAEALANLALFLIFSDKVESAIKLLKRAFRLNPIPPPHYYYFLAGAYRSIGDYEKAIESAKKSLNSDPDQLQPYLTLAASYSSLDRTEDARKAVEEILRIDPDFSLEYHANTLPSKNQENLNKYINALRKAGLPE